MGFSFKPLSRKVINSLEKLNNKGLRYKKIIKSLLKEVDIGQNTKNPYILVRRLLKDKKKSSLTFLELN